MKKITNYGWEDCCPLCGNVNIAVNTCGIRGFKWKKGYVYFSDAGSISDWSESKYIYMEKQAKNKL